MLPSLGDLATAGIALIAAIVALRLVYLTLAGFALPTIHVADIAPVKSADDPPGVTELIQSELVALREEGGGAGLQLLTTPDAAIDLGPIASVSDNMKTLSALLRLLPGRTKVVSGRMQPKGALGQGITLTIRTSSNRIAGTVTLWESQFVRADELPADVVADADRAAEARTCLGLAAAAWVAYRALDSMDATQRTGLLTQDWESYALFRVGARMQVAGLRTLARRRYLKALDRDPRNRGALFNLAVLDLYEQNEESAMERLEAVLGELRRNPLGDRQPWRLDRLWYRAQYNLATAAWNRFLRNSGPDDEAPGLARRELPEPVEAADDVPTRVKRQIRELVEATDETIADLGGAPAVEGGSRFDDLIRFLMDVRAAAIVLYGEIATRAGAGPQ